mgnify:CR=1 FL=1
MLPQQLSNLKNLINNSTILSAAEQAEWLKLSQLMNDKQLSELEQILKQQLSAQQLVTKSSGNNNQPKLTEITPPKPLTVNGKTDKNQFLPRSNSGFNQINKKLSHISNPPHINNSSGQIRTVKPLPSSLGARRNPVSAANLKRILEEKELPKPEEHKSLPQIEEMHLTPQVDPKTPDWEMSDLVSAVKAGAANNQPVDTEQTSVYKKPIVSSQSVSQQQNKQKPLQLLTAEDAQTLLLTHFRAVNKDKLIKALQTLVNRFGYFKVLLNLEQSQLYQIYIDSGKKMLAETGSDNKDLMTKEEF